VMERGLMAGRARAGQRTKSSTNACGMQSECTPPESGNVYAEYRTFEII
jgi:hypothetical protein